MAMTFYPPSSLSWVTRLRVGPGPRWFGFVLGWLVVWAGGVSQAGGAERPGAGANALRDPVAALQARIETGQARLVYDAKSGGYLSSLLEALGVPKQSQTLVFSKTSQMREWTSPATPRAIYFNDQVYVAAVAGAPRIEILAIHPANGGVFYTLDQEPTAHVRLESQEQCLECHTAAKNFSVSGPLLRSFATDDQGRVDLKNGLSHVDATTPFRERWGGWYVTGKTAGLPHRGNMAGLDQFKRFMDQGRFVPDSAEVGARLSPGYFSGQSDVVALLVLDHQAHLQNLLTRLHQDVAGSPAGETGAATAPVAHVEDLVRGLLSVGEAPLTGRVEGSSGFARGFEDQGPKDKKGRSLRQLDLETRTFRFRCSYMIYSPGFRTLPGPVQRQVFKRLWDILQDRGPDAYGLTPTERTAIREILADTHPDIPRYWTL